MSQPQAELATPPLVKASAAEAPAGRQSEPPVAAPTAADPNPGTPRVRTERELRNAYASATDPTDAGLDLAGFLARAERYFEALHVIDQALERKRTIALRIARAGLLRDVARCDLAAVELQGVVREMGLERVGPATLFALAQVEWVAGLDDSARATLRDLLRVHSQTPWMRANLDDVKDWRARIERRQPGRDLLANGALRDLFALLRAAPIPTARLKLLDRLAKPSSENLHDQRRGVRIRAIAIACGDQSAAVRTRAVQLAAANELQNPEFWQAALLDVAPLVRRTAARLCVASEVSQADDASRAAVPDTLRQALAAALLREADPAAFRALHEALRRVARKRGSLQEPQQEPLQESPQGSPPQEPPMDWQAVDLTTEQGREEVRAYWKERTQ